MSIQTVCPNCEASYTLADTQRGKKVRCRKCSNTFVVEGTDAGKAPAAAAKTVKAPRTDALQPSPRPAPKSPPPKTQPAAKRDKDRDREDDEDDDRLDRKPEVKKKPKSAMPLILMIGGGILVLFLLCGGAAAIGAYWWASSTATTAVDNMQNDFQNAQNNMNNNMPLNPGGPIIVLPPGPGGRSPFDQPKDIDDAVDWIKNSNRADDQIRAADWLSRAVPDENHRPQVAAALAGLVDKSNTHDAGLRGLAVWAGKEQAPLLIQELKPAATGQPGAGSGPAVDALVRLKEPAVIPFIAEQLPNFFEHGNAAKKLASIGPIAEKEVLKYLNHPNGDARNEADKLLQGYGTTDAARLTQSLADLRSPEKETVKQACERIAKTPVDAARQAEAARALETPLADPDGETRKAAALALKTWATKDNVPALIAEVDRQDPFNATFEPCASALARLKDEKGAEAIAKHLTNVFQRDITVKVLREMGPVAERAVAAYVNNPDQGAAQQASLLIKGYGTKSDVILAALLEELNSKEANQRKTACESLATKTLDEANQKPVARALDTLLDDPDGGVAEAAAKAEVVWGDKDSVPALVKGMTRPNSNIWQPCMDALARIKDEKAVVPLLVQSVMGMPHRDYAVKTLQQFGPIVESALDNVLMDPASTPQEKVGACNVLVEVGTAKSVPLLEAAAKDPNPLLKKAAATALSVVKKRS